MASTAAAAATTTAEAAGQCDLPKNVVKRLIKEKLCSVPGGKADLQINKEALLAFGESAKVFISFITAAANDVCKEKKRATINADDVFQALDDLEFGDLVPALQEAFEVYKQSSKEKKEKKAEVTRKRKSEAQEGAAAAAGDADADAGGGDEPADTTAASDKSGGDAGPAAAAAGAARPASPALEAAADADMEDAAASDMDADGGQQDADGDEDS